MPIHVLCPGSVRGMVNAVAPALDASTGASLQVAVAGPATLARRLSRGAAADLVILPRPMIETLAGQGHVDPASIIPVGFAALGLAVRAGDPAPQTADDDALADALGNADAIYLADPREDGSGRTVKTVLDELEIGEDVADSLAVRSDGVMAMEALAEADDDVALGLAEVSEILSVATLSLVTTLSEDLAPRTVYAAAVPTLSVEATGARRVIAMMTAPDAETVRNALGLGPA